MYGSWEAQMIGCECPEGTLHVNEEVVAVELLSDDGTPSAAGEFGNVAVTLLHNPEFPLIRYLLGDVARRSPRGCRCERPQAALELGIARREEMISCRDGRRLHPRLIRSALERELGPRLRSFHTVQEAPGRFSSSVELDGGRLPARLAALIEAELRAGMDEDDVSVRVHQSDRGQIERLRGGKLRTFSNRCPERAAGG
jgi:phenylacetate-CoA ligase